MKQRSVKFRCDVCAFHGIHHTLSDSELASAMCLKCGNDCEPQEIPEDDYERSER